MKKYLMAIVATLFVGSAMALENEPKNGFTWQVFAGFDVANLKGDFVPPTVGKGDPKVGALLGFKVDYMLPNAKGTYITAGVDWIQRGSKRDFIDPVKGTGTYKIQAHYIEIPIRVAYRYNINKLWGVYGELGPYLAVGIGGKLRQNFDDDSYDSKKTKYFTKKYAQTFMLAYDMRAIQRFDCGIGFRVGGEYHNQYSLTLGYDWGFTDSYINDFRKNMKNDYGVMPGIPLKERKNHNFALTFGYRF